MLKTPQAKLEWRKQMGLCVTAITTLLQYHSLSWLRWWNRWVHINNDKEENIRRRWRLPWWPLLRERRRWMIDLHSSHTKRPTATPYMGMCVLVQKGKRLACVCVCGWGRKALEVCHFITSTSVNLANMFLALTHKHIFQLFIYPDRVYWWSVFSFPPFFFLYLISAINRGMREDIFSCGSF